MDEKEERKHSLSTLIDLDKATEQELAFVRRISSCYPLKLLQTLDLIWVVHHDQQLSSEGRDSVLERGEIGEEGEREGERREPMRQRMELVCFREDNGEDKKGAYIGSNTLIEERQQLPELLHGRDDRR